VALEALQRGDLYINGWLLEWWSREFPSRSVDDLVEFVAHDLCSDIPIFGPSDARFIHDS